MCWQQEPLFPIEVKGKRRRCPGKRRPYYYYYYYTRAALRESHAQDTHLPPGRRTRLAPSMTVRGALTQCSAALVNTASNAGGPCISSAAAEAGPPPPGGGAAPPSMGASPRRASVGGDDGSSLVAVVVLGRLWLASLERRKGALMADASITYASRS